MNIVIIGNSAAGINAVEEIRRHHKDDKIIIISKETEQPYSRVLLPYFLRGKLPNESQLFIRENNFYKKNNIEFINGEVISLNSNEKTVYLSNGKEIVYNKLLISSGSRPFMPPIKGLELDNIYNMWTYEDCKNLEKHFKKNNKVLVLGSGFVSLQAAWAAVVKGLDVTIYELMPRIMGRVIDDYSASILKEKMIKFGVDVNLNISTTKIEKLRNGKLRVYSKNNDSMDVDFIIVGTGVKPNIEFLENTDIKVGKGILVDSHMKTSLEDVYAAGDVVEARTAFGEKEIHALWPTAVEQGKIAGKNIIGIEEDYCGSLNMNVTQMFDITVASMGKFMNEKDKNVWKFDLGKLGVFKVVLDSNVPIGASLIGKSELVEYLGILRPIIRRKKELNCKKDDFFKHLRMEMEYI